MDGCGGLGGGPAKGAAAAPFEMPGHAFDIPAVAEQAAEEFAEHGHGPIPFLANPIVVLVKHFAVGADDLHREGDLTARPHGIRFAAGTREEQGSVAVT